MQNTRSSENSSRRKRRNNLADLFLAKRAKELLEGVANLGDDDLGWFQKKYPYVLEELPPMLVLMEETDEDSGDSYPYYAPPADIGSK